MYTVVVQYHMRSVHKVCHAPGGERESKKVWQFVRGKGCIL